MLRAKGARFDNYFETAEMLVEIEKKRQEKEEKERQGEKFLDDKEWDHQNELPGSGKLV